MSTSRRVLIVVLTLLLTVGILPASTMAAPQKGPDKATIDRLVAVASELLVRRDQALLARSDASMATTRFVPSFGRSSTAASAAELAATTELSARRDALLQVGEAYTSASTHVSLLSIDVGPNSATLHIEQDTRLTYAKLAGDEPDYTEFVTPRDVFFSNDSGGWILEKVALATTEGPVPIDEPTGATAAAMAVVAKDISAAREAAMADTSSKGASGQSSSLAVTASYNYSAMAAYAEQYWHNYNPDYRTFNEHGGDCTNFVSQAMRAGGWPDASPGFYRDDNYWWYNFLNQTWTWINVGYFYTFAAVRSHRTYILSTPESMLLADILQADFSNDGEKDHTMLVTYVSGSSRYLTYHTTDTYRRSLASIKLAYPSARWIPHRT